MRCRRRWCWRKADRVAHVYVLWPSSAPIVGCRRGVLMCDRHATEADAEAKIALAHIRQLEPMTPIDRLEEACQELSATPLPPDHDAADWIGRLAQISRIVNEYKRSLLVELPGAVRGDRYQIVETNTADRSYNSAAILRAFADEGIGLPDLVRADVVRLSWRWSELQRIARGKVDLRVTQREIEDTGDIDGPMVGEVWKLKQEVKGV